MSYHRPYFNTQQRTYSRNSNNNNNNNHYNKKIDVFSNLKLPNIANYSIENYIEGFHEKESESLRVNSILNQNLDNSKHYEQLISNYFSILENNKFKNSRLANKSTLEYLKKSVECVGLRKNILFCIDVEAFEFNQNQITEVGISIYDPRLQQNAIIPLLKTIHIIIEEYEYKKNGKFVVDNKDNFLGGESLIMKALDSAILIQLLVNYYFKTIPETTDLQTTLVGHNVQGDLKWFEKIGIKMPEIFDIIDTQKLWTATHGKEGGSLSRILRYIKIPHAYLHNAGNDSYYTLVLALNLCDPYIRLLHDLDAGIPEPSAAASAAPAAPAAPPTASSGQTSASATEDAELEDEEDDDDEDSNSHNSLGAVSSPEVDGIKNDIDGIHLETTGTVKTVASIAIENDYWNHKRKNSNTSPKKFGKMTHETEKKTKRKIKQKNFDIVDNVNVKNASDAINLIFEPTRRFGI